MALYLFILIGKYIDSVWVSKTYKVLTPKEIMASYPVLKNIPKDYIGILDNCSGYINASKILKLLSDYLLQTDNVCINYNSEVISVSANSVKLSNGEEYFSNKVVIWTGWDTMKYFDTSSKAIQQEVEYFIFKKSVDMPPPTFHEFRPDGGLFYGSLEPTEEGITYKIGHYYDRNFKKMIEYLRERMPSMRGKIIHSTPWYFTKTPNSEFLYKTDQDGVYFAYGFSGTGFKFLPLHGKIVHEGLKENQFWNWKKGIISKL